MNQNREYMGRIEWNVNEQIKKKKNKWHGKEINLNLNESKALLLLFVWSWSSTPGSIGRGEEPGTPTLTTH